MQQRIAFEKQLEEAEPDDARIAGKCAEVRAAVLGASEWLDGPNFETIHPDDLERMAAEYDRVFFNGRVFGLLGDTDLRFRLSKRMTRLGGTTTRFVRRDDPTDVSYEIAVSTTLLFQTFSDVQRSVVVNGLKCGDRFEALQRVFEHELIHLIELLVWGDSSCSRGRFQSMAARFFGHSDHRHQLVTSRERAEVNFGVRPGGRVRFNLDGASYVGVVNRITKRATVLVEDGSGNRYSDGKRYLKFYVPLGMLQPLD